MASTTATHRSSERLDRVRGIAVEAKLNSRQVTVPLRMVGDFPLIMENCGSPTSICSSPISTGKVLRPVRSKDSIDERSIDERSVRSLDSRSIRSISIDGRSIRSIEEEPDTPTKDRKVRRSLSRKSHHEYIDVGSCIPSKPPPLPPKNKIEDDYDDEYEYFSTVSSTNSEGGNQNMLKQIRILQERNSFLEETNKKLRRENLVLNHQLEEVMKSNPSKNTTSLHDTVLNLTMHPFAFIIEESEMMRRRKSSLDIISKYHCTEVRQNIIHIRIYTHYHRFNPYCVRWIYHSM